MTISAFGRQSKEGQPEFGDVLGSSAERGLTIFDKGAVYVGSRFLGRGLATLTGRANFHRVSHFHIRRRLCSSVSPSTNSGRRWRKGGKPASHQKDALSARWVALTDTKSSSAVILPRLFRKLPGYSPSRSRRLFSSFRIKRRSFLVCSQPIIGSATNSPAAICKTIIPSSKFAPERAGSLAML